MAWLTDLWNKVKDTAKEVVTGGKAVTQTYNNNAYQQQQTQTTQTNTSNGLGGNILTQGQGQGQSSISNPTVVQGQTGTSTSGTSNTGTSNTSKSKLPTTLESMPLGSSYDQASGVYTAPDGKKYSIAIGGVKAAVGATIVNQGQEYDPNLAMQQANQANQQVQPQIPVQQTSVTPQSTQTQPGTPGQTGTGQPTRNEYNQEIDANGKPVYANPMSDPGMTIWDKYRYMIGPGYAGDPDTKPTEVPLSSDPGAPNGRWEDGTPITEDQFGQVMNIDGKDMFDFYMLATGVKDVVKYGYKTVKGWLSGASKTGEMALAEGGTKIIADTIPESAGKVATDVAKPTTNSIKNKLTNNIIVDILKKKVYGKVTVGAVVIGGELTAVGANIKSGTVTAPTNARDFITGATALQSELIATGDPTLIALAGQVQNYMDDMKEGYDVVSYAIPFSVNKQVADKYAENSEALAKARQQYDLYLAAQKTKADAKTAADKVETDFADEIRLRLNLDQEVSVDDLNRAAAADPSILLLLKQKADTETVVTNKQTDAELKRQQDLADAERKRQQDVTDLADKRAYDAATLAEKRAYDEAQKRGTPEEESVPGSSLNFGLLKTSGGYQLVNKTSENSGSIVTDKNTVANYYFPGIPYDQLTAQQKALIDMMTQQQ